jgi:signal transduction histidine kinase/DNA-binding response OmpR family regulator
MINHVDLMAALTADYLNVYVVRPKEDSFDTIKLKGYVTSGINADSQNLCYSKFLRIYAEDRVHSKDRDYFLNALLPECLVETFSDGRQRFECDYRILEDGKIHYYSVHCSRISLPDEDLRLVVAFRNVDSVISAENEQHTRSVNSAYSAISSLFFSLHRINVKENTYTTIKTTSSILGLSNNGTDDYDVNMTRVISGISSDWSCEDALRFMDRSTLNERMAGKNHIMLEFLSYALESCVLHFFREDDDENGNLYHAIFAVEMENDEKSQAIIDALSREYQNVFLIDLEKGSGSVLKMEGYVSEEFKGEKNQRFIYEELNKKYASERVHPDDAEAFLHETSIEHLRETFKDNDEIAGSYRVLADGETHHYRYTYFKLSKINSVIAGYQNIDSIILKHTKEEEQQRKIEQEYQDKLKEQLNIFDTLSRSFLNVYIIDLEKSKLRVLKLQKEYEEILHIRRDAVLPFDTVLGYWLNTVVCPDDREEMTKIFDPENVKRLLSEHNEITGNYRSIIDGEVHHFQYKISKIDVPGFKAVLGYQNVDEIIEQHLAQERKEREFEEARTKIAREHAEVISSLSTIYSTIFRADVDTHNYDILTSVPQMDLVATKSGNFDDVKEQIITAFMAPEEQEPMREFLDLNTLAERLDGRNTISAEYRTHDDIWMEARFIVKNRDENGTVKEILYVARNITPRKKRQFEQQEQLAQALAVAQQANKAKSTFLNNMSHDIRTPMNAIIGFTALAQTHLDDKEQVQDYLAKINTSSIHLLSLINDILDMSRIESGTVKLEEKPIHIPDVLHDLRTMIHGLVNAKNQNLYIDTKDVIHENVLADKLRLNQVLINIVSNAVKYTQPGGDIIIRLLETPSSMKDHATYEFTVKDNGIGMSSEFVTHIFETFTREYSSTVSGVQGTGLGMAITKNIVDLMGGEINVESKEGNGSTFKVTFNFKLAGEALKIQPIPELLGAKVLVVDDDIDTCKSVSKMLRDIEMRPDWSTSGKEAIARTQEAVEINDEYKVYIIDYLIPDMNGIEVVRQIRKIISEDIPIIVLTAYDWAEFEQEARKAGVTAFVSKPLFMSELMSVLSHDGAEGEGAGAAGSGAGNAAEEEPKHYDYSGKHVLLVEDNELNREIAVALLENMGMKVDYATDGLQAVDIMHAAEDDKYDLIFMDIQMPKMDGYTAAREIRTFSNNKKANIPIVAMTANAFEEDRKKSFEAGMNEHIAKPINVDNIASVLDVIFGECE